MTLIVLLYRFATVVLGSDSSSRVTMDRLPKKELHGQSPIVTYANKTTLAQFENQARKDHPQQNGIILFQMNSRAHARILKIGGASIFGEF